jgi:hypothetical protein
MRAPRIGSSPNGWTSAWTAVLLVTSVVGCTAPVGSSLRVPGDAADTCRRLCGRIGLELSAVAIMANNVGCVCEERRQASRPPAATDREAVTGGMATILLQQERQRSHLLYAPPPNR